LEMAARRQALRLAAHALEQRLNADTSDHAGPQLACSCGGRADYYGRHSKTFESVLGPLQLERAYYHCAECRSGFCRRDQALRLESFSLTPRSSAHDGRDGSSGELRREQRAITRVGGSRSGCQAGGTSRRNVRGRRFPSMNVSSSKGWARWLLPCI
jgi:hypothetical protein